MEEFREKECLNVRIASPSPKPLLMNPKSSDWTPDVVQEL